ncbi:MAG: hypothetical protein JNM71_07565 [Flavobacterium lindanitolerans]|nr:DUF2231 domain-containing protein [Flavobacterium lindanitolerans]MBL7867864.1 hypothetical protein [Flavobacterium lindanitolerans]
MWRTELWHSFVVHLPIATLALASLGSVLYYFLAGRHKLFIQQFVFVTLVIGTIGTWIAIYTGELAYDVEVRKICDPQVLKSHQRWGYIMAFIYSAALLVNIISHYIKKAKKLFSILATILLVAGMAILFYVGHLGASLVYQQGAGTYKPSGNCSEFTK